MKFKFGGLFHGFESKIRIRKDFMVSVLDFIQIVRPDKCDVSIWLKFLEDNVECEKLKSTIYFDNYQFKKNTPITPVVDVSIIAMLLLWMNCEQSKLFRKTSIESFIRYIGGGINILETLRIKEECKTFVNKPISIIRYIGDTEQVENEICFTSIASSSRLKLDGIFQGRESEIRITPNNMISVFDFIRVAGGQENPRDTWKDITKKYKNEVVGFSDNFKFPGSGQRETPVINVRGIVKLLFWLPGETAKQFRSKSAEIMIRYLGGDLTLVDEIKTIDNHHIETPNNIAKVFRDEVNQNCAKTFLFNQDQINTSNKLIQHFGNQTDVFYLFSFMHDSEWYAKFGIVGEVREFHRRIDQHKNEFGDICFNNVMKCLNISKVESEFKETSIFRTNKVKIPKKNGGNHTEVIKLSEIVTTADIKNQMFKTAGDRDLDPPTYLEATNNVSTSLQTNNELSLREIDLEKTKEIQKTKQMELANQLEIKKLELEMKKLDFEMMKFTR